MPDTPDTKPVLAAEGGATSSADTSLTVPDAAAPSIVTVYELIHSLYVEIVEALDTPMDWDSLSSPMMNYSVIKPIVERYSPKPAKDEHPDNAANCLGAVLYALMANRIQFLRLVDRDLSQSSIQVTRADFCELLAIKIVRAWPDTTDEEELTSELVRTWGALDGAPETVTSSVDKDDIENARDSALELAIVSVAKRFLSQPLIQHLVGEIYSGEIVFQPQTSHSIIADNYVSPRTRRRRAAGRTNVNSEGEYDPDAAEVYKYNPYLAGWLDYTRLRVPCWRHWIEFGSFCLLLALFVATLSTRDLKRVTSVEAFFVLYTFGFMLDEFAAARENGWFVYFANAWNVFDISYIVIFLAYFVLRIISLVNHSKDTSDLAFDILALGACILFPRLVFFFIKNNVVILALRGMIATYVRFMLLTAVAFSGICFCLWELGRPNGWTVSKVALLMFRIWFGSSNVNPRDFHPTFGPIILMTYSALCHTFLITMMMSMISNKYARIYSNAKQEYLFQRVVGTVEGVKSDAVFSYIPPFNLAAMIILLPLSAFTTPETLHRVNVFLIRLTNFPILFAISAYERYAYRITRRQIRLTERGQVTQKRRGGLLDSFLGSGSEVLITAAFEVDPPEVSDSVSAPPLKADKTSDTEAPAEPQPKKETKTGKPTVLAKLFKNDPQGRTVTVSAEEWNAMCESQKRLEAMLEKIAAVTGA